MEIPGVGPYDFVAPQHIVFGWGRWREVGRAAARLGSRAFVVLGSRTLAAAGFGEQLAAVLGDERVEAIELATILREPEVQDVDRVAADLRAHGVRQGDLVIGVGGGSAIDLAKAAAALATNTASTTVKDYLEGVGSGLSITVPPLAVIAMPTTAGTGSEATKNAVISSYDPPFKKSLRSDLMMPRAVVIDPQLHVPVSREVTVRTGMDAITQLIESYISSKARPIAQALALAGLPGALASIVEAADNPGSREARESMAQAALLSGMALANSGLGMAHGVAAALGVHLRVPHGLACAVMLPVALRTNREISRARLARLAEAAGIAPRDGADGCDALVERIDAIASRLGIPGRLSQLGVTARHIPLLVRDARGNSMNGNPRPLSDEELSQILEDQL